MMRRDSEKRRFRRGNAAIVGLGLAGVLGFGALAVDISMQRVADAQVQAAIEAAVLGGASALERTIPSIYAAQQLAVEIANSNPVVGDWSLEPSDVEVGIYSEGSFQPIDPSTLQPGDPEVQQINALRIATTHDGIAAVLAKAAFGTEGLSTSNTAMAMRPNQGGTAKSVPCYLPLAIPDCDYVDWLSGAQTEINPKPRHFAHANSIIDNIGWGRPQPKDNPYANDNPDTHYIKGAFEDNGCHDEPIELGQTMRVANGANNSVLMHIRDLLKSDVGGNMRGDWDYSVGPRPLRDGDQAHLPSNSALNANDWANEPVLEGPVALMKVDPSQCGSNIQFNGTWEISGFAWAMVYDVGTPSEKGVWVQLDFINERDFGGAVDPGGMGPVTGLDKPVLVF